MGITRLTSPIVHVQRAHSIFGVTTGATDLILKQRNTLSYGTKVSVNTVLHLLVTGKAELIIERAVWKSMVRHHRGQDKKTPPKQTPPRESGAKRSPLPP